MPTTTWVSMESRVQHKSKQRDHRGFLCGRSAHIREQAPASNTCNCSSLHVYSGEPHGCTAGSSDFALSDAGSCPAWPPPAVKWKQDLVHCVHDSASPPYLVVLLQRSLQLLHLLLFQLVRGARHRRGVEKSAGYSRHSLSRAGSGVSMSGQACVRELKQVAQGTHGHLRSFHAGARGWNALQGERNTCRPGPSIPAKHQWGLDCGRHGPAQRQGFRLCLMTRIWVAHRQLL